MNKNDHDDTKNTKNNASRDVAFVHFVSSWWHLKTDSNVQYTGAVNGVSVILAGALVCFVGLAVAVGASSPSPSAQSTKLPDVSGIPATNPIPYASASIGKGKATYLRLCPECHDDDGKALAQTLAPAADLTDPSRWKFGTGDAHLFRSIRDGAGAAMPVFGNQLSANDIWDVVNFIRSIGPGSLQPKKP